MRRRRAVLVLALCAAAGAVLAASPATPTASAPPKPTSPPKAKARAAAPPLDFSGTWVIDVEASRGVNAQMEHAVLEVRQNGNRIWIESVENRNSKIVAEEIIVDGRAYEKALGANQKGTLEAAWGKDGKSLWLQVVAATEDNPVAATQRMIWRLRDGGKTWTRQTRTIQPDGTKDTFLVFRKREPARK